MTTKPLMTAEDLWALPEIPGKRFELVRGELVEVPGAGGLRSLIAGLLYRLLATLAGERDLVLAFGAGAGYIIGREPDIVRIPDASFVSWGRVPEGGIPEGYIPLAPDLAVEVVSPGDRADDVHDKVREYLEPGTRLVWILWPRRRSVAVHEPGGLARERRPDDELDGGDVLPGFRVRVAELFEVRRGR